MNIEEVSILKAIVHDQKQELERLQKSEETLSHENQKLFEQNEKMKKFITDKHPELLNSNHGVKAEMEEEALEMEPSESNTEELAGQLLKALRENPGMTTLQISKHLRIESKACSTILYLLRKQGVIKSSGQKRGTRYSLA